MTATGTVESSSLIMSPSLSEAGVGRYAPRRVTPVASISAQGLVSRDVTQRGLSLPRALTSSMSSGHAVSPLAVSLQPSAFQSSAPQPSATSSAPLPSAPKVRATQPPQSPPAVATLAPLQTPPPPQGRLIPQTEVRQPPVQERGCEQSSGDKENKSAGQVDVNVDDKDRSKAGSILNISDAAMKECERALEHVRGRCQHRDAVAAELKSQLRALLDDFAQTRVDISKKFQEAEEARLGLAAATAPEKTQRATLQKESLDFLTRQRMEVSEISSTPLPPVSWRDSMGSENHPLVDPILSSAPPPISQSADALHDHKQDHLPTACPPEIGGLPAVSISIGNELKASETSQETLSSATRDILHRPRSMQKHAEGPRVSLGQEAIAALSAKPAWSSLPPTSTSSTVPTAPPVDVPITHSEPSSFGGAASVRFDVAASTQRLLACQAQAVESSKPVLSGSLKFAVGDSGNTVTPSSVRGGSSSFPTANLYRQESLIGARLAEITAEQRTRPVLGGSVKFGVRSPSQTGVSSTPTTPMPANRIENHWLLGTCDSPTPTSAAQPSSLLAAAVGSPISGDTPPTHRSLDSISGSLRSISGSLRSVSGPQVPVGGMSGVGGTPNSTGTHDGLTASSRGSMRLGETSMTPTRYPRTMDAVGRKSVGTTDAPGRMAQSPTRLAQSPPPHTPLSGSRRAGAPQWAFQGSPSSDALGGSSRSLPQPASFGGHARNASQGHSDRPTGLVEEVRASLRQFEEQMRADQPSLSSTQRIFSCRNEGAARLGQVVIPDFGLVEGSTSVARLLLPKLPSSIAKEGGEIGLKVRKRLEATRLQAMQKRNAS